MWVEDTCIRIPQDILLKEWNPEFYPRPSGERPKEFVLFLVNSSGDSDVPNMRTTIREGSKNTMRMC